MPEVKEIKKEVWTVSENELNEPKSAVYSDEILEKEREIETIEVTKEVSHIITSEEEEVSSPLYDGKEVLETTFDTNKDAKVEVMVKKLSPGSEMIEICSLENITKDESDDLNKADDTKDESATEQFQKDVVIFETCNIPSTEEKVKSDITAHTIKETVAEIDISASQVLPEDQSKTEMKSDEEFIHETFKSITEVSYEVSKSTIDAFKKGGNDKLENKWQRESPDNISIVKETMEPSLGKSEIFICTEETLDNVKKILSVADAESNVVVPEGESSVSEMPEAEQKGASDVKDQFICMEENIKEKHILPVEVEPNKILLAEEQVTDKDKTDKLKTKEDSIVEEFNQDVKSDIKLTCISPVKQPEAGPDRLIERSTPESPESKHVSVKLDADTVSLEESSPDIMRDIKEKIETTDIDDIKRYDTEELPEEVLSQSGSNGDKSGSGFSSGKDRSIEIEFLPVLEVSDDVKVTVDKTGHEALGTPCSFHKEMSIESQHSELEQSFENRQSDSSNGKKIPLTSFGAVEKAEYEEVEKDKKKNLEDIIYRESVTYEKGGKETVQCVEVTRFTEHTTEVFNVPSEKLREKFSSKKIHIEASVEEKDSKASVPQKLNQFLDSVTQLDDIALPSDVAPVYKRTEEWLDQSGELMLKEGTIIDSTDIALYEDRPPTLDDEQHRRSSPTAESFDDKARVEQCDTDVMMQLLDFVSRNDIEMAEVRTEDEAPDIEEDVSPSGEEEICSRITYEEPKVDEKHIIHESIEEKADEYLKVSESDNILHSPLRSSFDSATSPSKRDLSLDNVETVVEAKHGVDQDFRSDQISQQIHPQSSLEVEVGSHDSDDLGYIEREIVPLSYVEEEESSKPDSKILDESISKFEDIEQDTKEISATSGVIGICFVKQSYSCFFAGFYV